MAAKNENSETEQEHLNQLKEWRLPTGSKPRTINSIQHFLGFFLGTRSLQPFFFFADSNNASIIILDKNEEFAEFCFDEENNGNLSSFNPLDMCLMPHDKILAVCGEHSSGFGKIVLLQIKLNRPFLQLRKIITTKETIFYSLCLKDDAYFCCLDGECRMHCFSKNGKKLTTMEVNGLMGKSVGVQSRIRAERGFGKMCTSALNLSTAFCFDLQDGRINSMEKRGNEYFDFSIDFPDRFYFATKDKIIASSLQNYEDVKTLYEFPKKSECFPLISVFINGIIACIKIDGEYLIKYFGIN